MTYNQVRKDFEHLESISELDDWVEIDSCMHEFMEKPTLTFAKGLYLNAISLWFHENAVCSESQGIAEVYGFGAADRALGQDGKPENSI